MPRGEAHSDTGFAQAVEQHETAGVEQIRCRRVSDGRARFAEQGDFLVGKVDRVGEDAAGTEQAAGTVFLQRGGGKLRANFVGLVRRDGKIRLVVSVVFRHEGGDALQQFGELTSADRVPKA